jgi:hypothetical protein
VLLRLAQLLGLGRESVDVVDRDHVVSVGAGEGDVALVVDPAEVADQLGAVLEADVKHPAFLGVLEDGQEMLAIAHVGNLPAQRELTHYWFARRRPGTAGSMWGSSFTLIGLPLALILLLIALAFGTAAPVFAVLIAAAILLVVAVVYAARRGQWRVSKPGEPGGPGRPSGAPVAGEGSGSPLAPSE